MSATSPTSASVETDDAADLRAYVRWNFKGTPFPVRMGRKRFQMRLKDLSRGGASGLMEEPVAVGDYVLIEFDERHVVEAKVCWVRRVMVGVRFGNPLTATFITRLHERAAEEQPPGKDEFHSIAPRLGRR